MNKKSYFCCYYLSSSDHLNLSNFIFFLMQNLQKNGNLSLVHGLKIASKQRNFHGLPASDMTWHDRHDMTKHDMTDMTRHKMTAMNRLFERLFQWMGISFSSHSRLVSSGVEQWVNLHISVIKETMAINY